MISRRNFLQAASASAVATSAVAMFPRIGQGMTFDAPARLRGDPIGDPIDDAALKELLAIAIDTARSAGATYADARITIIRSRIIMPDSVRDDDEWRAIGVRVLADNCWGFMSSGWLTTDEATRLGVEAVLQAQSHAVGEVLEVDLGSIPRVDNGVWKSPVIYDPFDIPIGEQRDFCAELSSLMTARQLRTSAGVQMFFRRERKLFLSSEGSTFDQTTYASGGDVGGSSDPQYSKQLENGIQRLPVFPLMAKGWEYFTDTDFPQRLEHYAEWLRGIRYRKPVEVDRCDAVLSPLVLGHILDSVVGAATELDRAMGYQANANGTSYLNDPLEMLGTYQIGSDALTIEGSRSMPAGLATVKWDDEGVEPDVFPLVEKGMLADFQTTREQAAWLAPYYTRANKPVRSHGCAAAESALYVTTQHTPNLRIVPGDAGVSEETLIRDIKRGVYVEAGLVQVDHQQLNGFIVWPTLRLIRDGKLGNYVEGAGIPFRGPDFLKRVVALGGPETSTMMSVFRTRGEPSQQLMHSISSVPAKVENVDIIDAGRAGGLV